MTSPILDTFISNLRLKDRNVNPSLNSLCLFLGSELKFGPIINISDLINLVANEQIKKPDYKFDYDAHVEIITKSIHTYSHNRDADNHEAHSKAFNQFLEWTRGRSEKKIYLFDRIYHNLNDDIQVKMVEKLLKLDKKTLTIVPKEELKEEDEHTTSYTRNGFELKITYDNLGNMIKHKLIYPGSNIVSTFIFAETAERVLTQFHKFVDEYKPE